MKRASRRADAVVHQRVGQVSALDLRVVRQPRVSQPVADPQVRAPAGARRAAAASAGLRPGCASAGEDSTSASIEAGWAAAYCAATSPPMLCPSTISGTPSGVRVRGALHHVGQVVDQPVGRRQAAARAARLAVAVLVVAAHREPPVVELQRQSARSAPRARPARAPAAPRRAAGRPRPAASRCTARLSPSLAVKVDRVAVEAGIMGRRSWLCRQPAAIGTDPDQPRRASALHVGGRPLPPDAAPGAIRGAHGIRAMTSATAAVSRLA